jgi:hypothetical protein
MIAIVFWIFLASFSSFVLSSSTAFRKEHERIMSNYNSRNEVCFHTFKIYYLRLPLESILALDAIEFFRGMQNVNDLYFLTIFWSSFETSYVICCPAEFWNHAKKFIALIISNNRHQYVVSEMIYHFKVYLTKKLYSYSKNEEREELLSKEMHFFSTKLAHLVRKLGRNMSSLRP